MKKVIVLLAVLMLSVSAFAGPLVGIQVAPAVNSMAALTLGWDFGYSSIEGSKSTYNTWYGDWSIAALWTPADQTFSYRLGPKIIWNWNSVSGAIKYKDLAIVLGVSRTWGAFQLFGELDIGSTAALSIKPIIGVNVIFGNFFSKPITE